MATKFILINSMNESNGRISEAIAVSHLNYNHIEISHCLQRGFSPLFYTILPFLITPPTLGTCRILLPPFPQLTAGKNKTCIGN